MTFPKNESRFLRFSVLNLDEAGEASAPSEGNGSDFLTGVLGSGSGAAGVAPLVVGAAASSTLPGTGGSGTGRPPSVCMWVDGPMVPGVGSVTGASAAAAEGFESFTGTMPIGTTEAKTGSMIATGSAINACCAASSGIAVESAVGEGSVVFEKSTISSRVCKIDNLEDL